VKNSNGEKINDICNIFSENQQSWCRTARPMKRSIVPPMGYDLEICYTSLNHALDLGIQKNMY
jgi:hypothetical protein